MDQGFKQMLTMIEGDGVSLAKKAEMCKNTRPDLTAQIEEFYSMRRSLAEHYDYLIAESYKSIPSEFQMQGAGDSESGYGVDSLFLTPDQKLGFQKAGHRVASVSPCGGSSDLSLKEGSDSSSSSLSSDSESESFNSSGNAHFSLPINTDRSGLHQKIIELVTELPSMEEKLQVEAEINGDGVLNTQDNRNYEELLGRVVRYEEELRVSKLKLQRSGEEVTRLKSELERSESLMVLAGTLQAQLESAHRDVKMREVDVEVERRKVLELQKQIAEGTHELQGQLELAQEEIITLKAKLDAESRQVWDLQESILCYKNDLSDRDHEVKALKVALLDAQEKFSVEKAHLDSDIFSLSEKQNVLEARLRGWESQSKSLEDKLRQFDVEKMEMKGLHDAQEIRMQAEISQLKVELTDRSGHVEALNKNLDSLKFKYDMLMAEKDGLIAKLNTLVADMSSQDNQIRQMEEHLRQLHVEYMEVVAGSESAQKVVDELRLRAVELEKEVDRQKVEISAGAEEKREAIRQLCFSLDHYRSGYKELCQAFLGHRRHVMAS